MQLLIVDTLSTGRLRIHSNIHIMLNTLYAACGWPWTMCEKRVKGRPNSIIITWNSHSRCDATRRKCTSTPSTMHTIWPPNFHCPVGTLGCCGGGAQKPKSRPARSVVESETPPNFCSAVLHIKPSKFLLLLLAACFWNCANPWPSDTRSDTHEDATQQRDDGECPKYFTSVCTSLIGHIHIREIIRSHQWMGCLFEWRWWWCILVWTMVANSCDSF